MGVISVRFNEKEEKMIGKLTEHYHQDKSKLLKTSVMELYESLLDQKEVDDFEKREKKNKVKFHSSNEVLKMMEGL